MFGEGDWVTLFGESLDQAGYAKWRDGEPNNLDGGENCGSLKFYPDSHEARMNDLPCDNELPYVCEFNHPNFIH